MIDFEGISQFYRTETPYWLKPWSRKYYTTNQLSTELWRKYSNPRKSTFSSLNQRKTNYSTSSLSLELLFFKLPFLNSSRSYNTDSATSFHFLYFIFPFSLFMWSLHFLVLTSFHSLFTFFLLLIFSLNFTTQARKHMPEFWLLIFWHFMKRGTSTHRTLLVTKETPLLLWRQSNSQTPFFVC